MTFDSIVLQVNTHKLMESDLTFLIMSYFQDVGHDVISFKSLRLLSLQICLD